MRILAAVVIELPSVVLFAAADLIGWVARRLEMAADYLGGK